MHKRRGPAITVDLRPETFDDLRYVARTRRTSVCAVIRHLITAPTTLDRIIDRQQQVPPRLTGSNRAQARRSDLT